MVNIIDTDGFFLDLTLDTEGAGAYEFEINSGVTPNKKTFRVIDDKLETVNLQAPQNLEQGTSIKLTTRGTEVSTVEYDKRYVASLYKLSREFNTPTAEKVNGRLDNVIYPQGTFQKYTVEQVIQWICSQTGGTLIYGGGAPGDYAGPVVFRNTPVPQAIQQILEQEGNNIWYVNPADNRSVMIVNRSPAANPVGQVGVNVMTHAITGGSAGTGLGVQVLDKDGRGLKVQYGGPAWVGRDTPDPTIPTYGALPPLEMEIDMSLLNAGQNGIQDYGYTKHKEDGQTGWHIPLDSAGFPIRKECRMVQKGTMSADGLTRLAGASFRAFQADLLTHPNLKFAFEAKVSGNPGIYLLDEVPSEKIASTRTIYANKIAAANGRLTSDISRNAHSNAKCQLSYKESSPYSITGPGGSQLHYRVCVLALFEPRWQFVNGWVDLDKGELVIDGGSRPTYYFLCDCYDNASGQISFDWTVDPAYGGSPQRPIAFVKVKFQEAVLAASFRAHVVTTEALPAVTIGVGPPWGATERGDFEQHNVIYNIAKVTGFEEPGSEPRDDTDTMQAVAQNLALQNSTSGAAKGSIRIYPGDESLLPGQAANGGVIVKVKHRYVPYFSTEFWLEGTPDIDNPEHKHWRRKIGEYQGLTQVNSAQITQNQVATQRASTPRGTNTVEPHTHSDDQQGGGTLGSIDVGKITIEETTPGGEPGLSAVANDIQATVDLKYHAGLSRHVSGDTLVRLTQISPSLRGKIYNNTELPEFEVTGLIVDGLIVGPSQYSELLQVDGIYPLSFAENEDITIPPAAYITLSSSTFELVTDHGHDDEAVDNISTTISGIVATATYLGDLDDLTIVDEFDATPRWALYMCEENNQASDAREGFIEGKGRNTADTYHKGYLSDIFMYTRESETNRLTVRHDFRVQKYTDESNYWEGPLRFEEIPTGSPLLSPPNQTRGAPFLYDDTDWRLVIECDNYSGFDAPDRLGSAGAGTADKSTSVVAPYWVTYPALHQIEARYSDLFSVYPMWWHSPDTESRFVGIMRDKNLGEDLFDDRGFFLVDPDQDLMFYLTDVMSPIYRGTPDPNVGQLCIWTEAYFKEGKQDAWFLPNAAPIDFRSVDWISTTIPSVPDDLYGYMQLNQFNNKWIVRVPFPIQNFVTSLNYNISGLASCLTAQDNTDTGHFYSYFMRWCAGDTTYGPGNNGAGLLNKKLFNTGTPDWYYGASMRQDLKTVMTAIGQWMQVVHAALLALGHATGAPPPSPSIYGGTYWNQTPLRYLALDEFPSPAVWGYYFPPGSGCKFNPVSYP